jgi:L-fuconolactonase
MAYPIIDAHQHYWDPSRFEYVWMSPAVQQLVRAFVPSDLRPLLQEAGVHQTVVVQAISSFEEARWLLELAADTDFIAGVVTWADLRSPQLGSQLDELQKHPKFCGVRHQVEDEPDDDWILRDDVVRGLNELSRREIPYDALVRPRHLSRLTALRQRCPELRIVIDHIAKPRIADRLFEPWATDIAEASRLPNTWCKLSGMNTEAKWDAWSSADLKPYVTHVLEQFGPDRVMFGSDWPVCILAGSYQQTLDALRECLGPLAPEDQRKVWAGTAATFYRLQR